MLGEAEYFCGIGIATHKRYTSDKPCIFRDKGIEKRFVEWFTDILR